MPDNEFWELHHSQDGLIDVARSRTEAEQKLQEIAEAHERGEAVDNPDYITIHPPYRGLNRMRDDLDRGVPDPDDHPDPFDPRLLGASRTAAVWDWRPYTPTLVQQLQDNDLWDGTGVDQRAWEARSEAGDHYTIRPAGSLFNTLPNDHPLKHTGDPSRWEVDHLPPEYGHDPEGYMGDIYGPTGLNQHAEPVEGVHPHGFSSVDEAMDWVKSRHPEESFNPDDRQDPFDPRLIGAALKAARYADSVLTRTAVDKEDLVLPPDQPHNDWQPKYKNENDPTVRQWHPPFGETHVKYHIYRGGGGRNPIVWSANHHGTYQGLETIDSPTGGYGSITWPLYSSGYEPDQLGRFRTPEQAQAAAEKHFADTYGRHQKMDGLDVDQVMREHGDRPRAGHGLGDDEDYGHIFGMLRQAGWDMADIVRLAGDGMSWEDTMAHIDKVLAEGEPGAHYGPTPSDNPGDFEPLVEHEPITHQRSVCQNCGTGIIKNPFNNTWLSDGHFNHSHCGSGEPHQPTH